MKFLRKLFKLETITREDRHNSKEFAEEYIVSAHFRAEEKGDEWTAEENDAAYDAFRAGYLKALTLERE